ncbi:MAG TPA: DUF1292 domain-containing protein [Thermoclostridium caenicola]|uniref:Uncharacterized protein n=1 Tax=Thermoclostridium caenicola TaxID=659425 RepID=A0A1M6EHC5_9FIRM|nr:DUF1292 domain-containing protein [Thermoclostridium caenicola]SHI84841.1 Protein of unknown function [Thermoclostridium caenicola]HOK43287.1 DUF1292 domain-containing protein [Thermoclostridium caenicola]HOL84937.1 DUF1292 domain-containing protein [Thermoclostridium caenicola]HOP72963.1 DUF1292 domain-containing protein [Thermoclostridium caenicola]HPO77065.1 DUF1292 domain-containing protein [Thermoclostridium caenicola]
MDYENEIIELTGEDGDTIKAEYLDTVLVDDNEYVVLLPVDEHECEECDDCEAEVIIMKIEKDGDEEYLVPVEDDDELERAFEAFQEQIEEYEDDDYEDEEDEDNE